MTKSNNARSNRGGRVVKTTEGTGSVAPTTEAVIEQPAEVAAEDNAPVDATESISEESAEVIGSETAPAESPAAEVSDAAPEAAPVIDIFADLPVIQLADDHGQYEYKDLVTAETSLPRKYEAVQRAAREAKLDILPNWKHMTAMISVGTHQRDFKPTSVYGTIDRFVREYGRAGIPAVVLASKVRVAQIGNKRSHFCDKLPPVGWAENWINTYISKNHGKVMAKVAPPLKAAEVAELKAEEAEAKRHAA